MRASMVLQVVPHLPKSLGDKKLAIWRDNSREKGAKQSRDISCDDGGVHEAEKRSEIHCSKVTALMVGSHLSSFNDSRQSFPCA